MTAQLHTIPPRQADYNSSNLDLVAAAGIYVHESAMNGGARIEIPQFG